MEDYCNKIIDTLFDEEESKTMFLKIIEFIVAQDEIDFDDRKTFERKETTDLLLNKTNELKKYIVGE